MSMAALMFGCAFWGNLDVGCAVFRCRRADDVFAALHDAAILAARYGGRRHPNCPPKARSPASRIPCPAPSVPPRTAGGNSKSCRRIGGCSRRRPNTGTSWITSAMCRRCNPAEATTCCFRRGARLPCNSERPNWRSPRPARIGGAGSSAGRRSPCRCRPIGRTSALYATKFQQMFAMDAARNGAARQTRRFPCSVKLIDDRAAAIQACRRRALRAVLEQYQFPGGAVPTSWPPAAWNCSGSGGRSSASVCDYNGTIADYSLTVVPLTLTPAGLDGRVDRSAAEQRRCQRRQRCRAAENPTSRRRPSPDGAPIKTSRRRPTPDDEPIKTSRRRRRPTIGDAALQTAIRPALLPTAANRPFGMSRRWRQRPNCRKKFR